MYCAKISFGQKLPIKSLGLFCHILTSLDIMYDTGKTLFYRAPVPVTWHRTPVPTF
jgi:hypothetical protein